MGFLSNGIFWGILLMLVGLVMLLKIIFGVNIPLFKILFGLFFIYIGVRIITGVSRKEDNSSSVVFGENRVKYDENNTEHNIVFSKGILDFSEARVGTTKPSQIHLVFSDGTLLINQDIPLKIKVKGAFSGCNFPDGTTISFGEYTYTTKAFSETQPYLLVNADVVFSALKVKTKTDFNGKEYSY